MSDNSAIQQSSENRLKQLTEALQGGGLQLAWKMLNDLHPAEVAHLLESLPPAERDVVWRLVELENEGEILLYVNDEVRAGLIQEMHETELVAAAEKLDLDDLADLINDFPDAVAREVLRSLDKQNRQRLVSVLAYPEDSAGGLMNVDTITVRADVTLDVVLRYLRLRGEIPALTDNLIVVNRFDHYLGTLSLTKLLTSDPSLTVADILDRQVEAIPASTSARDVASRFEMHDLISAPVVDENNKLLGRITIDDVVDVIRDEADHSLMSMAGLDEEDDMFAPVVSSTRRRAIWLGVNLITAFLAAWVIGLYQGTLEKVVALAVLMPIAASMGGVAGMQTLTLVIRGLAVGKVGRANRRWLLFKEVAVGGLNGFIWAIVVATIAVAWFQDLTIGMIIAAAMLINLIAAALAGFSIPLLLRRVGIDPALAGSVVLTTVTDVVGYMSFLGLATLYLIR